MVDKIALTSAELAYLLATFSNPTRLGLRTADVIGLSDTERSPGAVAAGFSSLIVRGLAVGGDPQVTFAPATSAIGDAITHPIVTAQIGLISGGKSDGTLLFESDRVRLLMVSRKHRCFDVVALDKRGDLGEQLLHITRSFLDGQKPGVVSIVVDTVGTGQPDDMGWCSIAADAGTWSVVFSRDPSEADRGLDKTQAMDRLETRLKQLLPGGVATPIA